MTASNSFSLNTLSKKANNDALAKSTYEAGVKQSINFYYWVRTVSNDNTAGTLTATTFTVTATNAAGTDTESFTLFIDADTDGDGIGNSTDPDIDGDGIDDIIPENYHDGKYNGLKKINGIWKQHIFSFQKCKK